MSVIGEFFRLAVENTTQTLIAYFIARNFYRKSSHENQNMIRTITADSMIFW